MPSKRQPSKQRRAAQNRAARSALAVRRENAARIAEEAVARPSSGGDPAETSAPAPASSARPRGAILRGHRDVPGGRAALLALLFAIGAGASLLLLRVPVDENGDALTRKQQDAREEAGTPDLDASFIDAVGPVGIVYVAVPIAAAGAGFWAVRERRGARWLTGALISLVASTALSGATILFLPSAAALAVASYQMRKAERLAAHSDPPPVEDDTGEGDDRAGAALEPEA